MSIHSPTVFGSAPVLRAHVLLKDDAMTSDQSSPIVARSQPIRFSGRRRTITAPTTANATTGTTKANPSTKSLTGRPGVATAVTEATTSSRVVAAAKPAARRGRGRLTG